VFVNSNRVLWVIATLIVVGLLLITPLLLVRDPNPFAVVETNMGTIKIELLPKQAPLSVANFIKYAEDKHYDGTIFHRVILDFMIQGGGFTPGELGPQRRKDRDQPIKNESDNGLVNKKGTVAMARTDAPDSATAEFFINVADNPGLDRENAKDKVGYAVFGKVAEGMEVVDKIRRVQTAVTDTGMRDVPVANVIIKSIRIER